MNNENENMNNTYSPEEQNRMRINQRKAELEQQRFQQIEAQNQQKIDQQEATNKAAKVGMKAAANYFAPGVGGQAVDLASNTKAGKRIINRVGKKLNRVPGMGSKMDNLNKSGALDTLDSATDLIGGGASSSAKPASSINANRGIPGNKLQGVVQPKELDQIPDQKNLNDSSELDDAISNNLNQNEEQEVESGTETEGQSIKGAASKKVIDFIKKHPEVAMYIGLGILAIFVFFLIFVVIIGIFTAVSGEESEDNSSTSSGTMSISSSVTPTSPDTELHESLGTFLPSKGVSVEDYNNFIAYSVNKAGAGTREGVVTAALSITSTLYEKFQVRLPYEWGGGHSSMYYGIKDSWGGALASPIAENNRLYKYSGLDCSGFVSWAIYNGGYKFSSMTSESFLSLGTTHPMSNDYTAKAGDLIHHYGHIMIIVGVDESTKTYQVAEAAGGDEGIRVISMPFSGNTSSKQNNIIDMTSFYSNESNKKEDYPVVTSSNLAGSSSSTSSSSSSSNKSIIIGDSRTVMTCKDYGLCQNDQYVAKVSMGYNWLVETAINETNNILNNNSGTKYNIYINLGANDYDYQANNYLNKINELTTSTWKDHNIIFVTVNPMSDENENAKIESFNNTIKSGLNSSVKYCDTYTKIKSSGYNATDGTHYDKDTSSKIYEYMKGC